MTTTTITLTTPVHKSARTVQVAGTFDYDPGDTQTIEWTHTLPLDDQPWQVGLIVGPSGAGKSVLARKLWPGHVLEEHPWEAPTILDDFDPEHAISDITGALTAVGFGTVPAWLRPYGVLSNGEKFRANMARSLLSGDDPIVVDEFTSVVDRQVAKVASHATQKAVRRTDRRFVAVTCHYDVEDWLQPDWVYDVAAREFRWRSVQPHPPVHLDVHQCPRTLWPLFEPHHYLSGSLAGSAVCFAAYIDGRPVAFTSYRHFPHAKVRNIKMGHRLVVLPDYQGLGIATRLEEWLGDYLAERGYRYRNVVAHPGMIRLYSRSPRWRRTHGRSKAVRTGKSKTGTPRGIMMQKRGQLSTRRLAVESFEYQPRTKPKEGTS